MSWKFINVVKLVIYWFKQRSAIYVSYVDTQLNYLFQQIRLLNFLTGRRPLKWNCDLKSTKTWDKWPEQLIQANKLFSRYWSSVFYSTALNFHKIDKISSSYSTVLWVRLLLKQSDLVSIRFSHVYPGITVSSTRFGPWSRCMVRREQFSI